MVIEPTRLYPLPLKLKRAAFFTKHKVMAGYCASKNVHEWGSEDS